MKALKFLFLFITDRRFRIWLERTLYYAIASHEVNRGFGASDVLLFNSKYSEQVFDMEALTKNNDTFRGFNEWDNKFGYEKHQSTGIQSSNKKD